MAAASDDPGAERQELMKTVAAATSSGLSIVGALYILGRYWYARRVKASGHAATATAAPHHLDVTKELVHVLAWLDLVGALGRIFGTLPTRTFDQSAGEHASNICNLQAVVITFGDGAPIAWNLVMAFNLFRWVCMGEDQQMLQRRIKWYILGTLVCSLLPAFLALGFGKFGDAGNWCWVVIPGEQHHAEELWWKLGVLYFWVLAGGAALCWLLALVKRDIRKRLESYENADARDAYDGVVHNLTIYIGGFIACWLPAVADRGYSAITSDDVFVLKMLHASILPLQGFVNAVIYGKFHIWIGRHVHVQGAGGSSYGKSSSHVSPKSSEDFARRSALQREHERQHFGTATVFVTTFDMGWNEFPTNLEAWIPAGKDLYVFSLQRCASVQQVEQAIRKYLLRRNYPTAYRSITSLAGSTLRGSIQDALVCQIVFVNNADDASGNFRFHAADGRVWSQRKTFKEVVGIPIRYFDASIAFVSCNLSSPGSDFAGSQRSVQEKHAIASSLIHSFGMDVDRAAVDFPNLYHHTILSGNLNYDVELPQQRVLSLMDQAFKAECLKQATDTAIDTKLKSVGSGVSVGGQPRQSLDRLSSPSDAHQNANVPVEWSLLYFKSRNSLGRSSNVSASSDDVLGLGDVVYREVYSSCDDNLPFTLLQSPQSAELQHQPVAEPPLTASMLSNSPRSNLRNTTVPESEPEVQIKIAKDVAGGSEAPSPELLEEKLQGSSSWFSFIDGLFATQQSATFPNRADRSSSASSTATTVRRSTVSGRNSSLVSNGSSANPREGKKASDLLSKSELVADNAARKWKELLRFDELRAAIEAKEVFCGFEEPPIQFLPSYPRQVGTGASFASLAERSCRDLFLDADGETDSASYPAPAYKDRVLAHSLQDTKQRLRNVAYWLCEEVVTSTHKPVCSLYELEIDRFFSYKMDEAAHRDFQRGKHALRDKTGVQEFKLKLVNLDANIWTTEAPRDAGLSLSSLSASRHHRAHRAPHNPNASPGAPQTASASGSQGNDSLTSSRLSDPLQQQHARPSGLKKKRSVANLVDRVLGKDRTRSSIAASSQRGGTLSTPNLYSDFSSDAQGVHPLAMAAGDRLSTLSAVHLELVPVEPVSITTVFPLPSEDLYALQRKVYEVAHSVQNGFQSSSKDDDLEESLLALTNCRTAAWTDAGHQGLTHTAITKAVNGVVHIAVTITAEKGHGGQGVLCIQESDLLSHATPVFSEAQPIPFDVTLTWGGKHVGYLHGDILSSL
ncbi:hypothetical protein PybrP1_000944 [[Pythium] brassicae (nom. inval.)]|nr:hypothetical protein PybrP1_000944 [[Pythium] brassicae (nom. inval.)]